MCCPARQTAELDRVHEHDTVGLDTRVDGAPAMEVSASKFPPNVEMTAAWKSSMPYIAAVDEGCVVTQHKHRQFLLASHGERAS